MGPPPSHPLETSIVCGTKDIPCEIPDFPRQPQRQCTGLRTDEFFPTHFPGFGESNRLDGVQVNVQPSTEAKQPSVLTAILIAIAPTRFDPFRHQSPAGQYK